MALSIDSQLERLFAFFAETIISISQASVYFFDAGSIDEGKSLSTGLALEVDWFYTSIGRQSESILTFHTLLIDNFNTSMRDALAFLDLEAREAIHASIELIVFASEDSANVLNQVKFWMTNCALLLEVVQTTN